MSVILEDEFTESLEIVKEYITQHIKDRMFDDVESALTNVVRVEKELSNEYVLSAMRADCYKYSTNLIAEDRWDIVNVFGGPKGTDKSFSKKDLVVLDIEYHMFNEEDITILSKVLQEKYTGTITHSNIHVKHTTNNEGDKEKTL